MRSVIHPALWLLTGTSDRPVWDNPLQEGFLSNCKCFINENTSDSFMTIFHNNLVSFLYLNCLIKYFIPCKWTPRKRVLLFLLIKTKSLIKGNKVFSFGLPLDRVLGFLKESHVERFKLFLFISEWLLNSYYYVNNFPGSEQLGKRFCF